VTSIRSAWIAASALLAAPGAAQSPSIAQAIQAGQVGERYDGYLGVVGTARPELRRAVSAVNIERRKLYTDLSARRNVTTELVGMATACQLLSQLTVGEAYMLSDGAWRRRGATAIPLPDYCR
jgi:uncharacterized protein YdbL (DUF1318 family)